jgi:hypothetical protein
MPRPLTLSKFKTDIEYILPGVTLDVLKSSKDKFHASVEIQFGNGLNIVDVDLQTACETIEDVVKEFNKRDYLHMLLKKPSGDFILFITYLRNPVPVSTQNLSLIKYIP